MISSDLIVVNDIKHAILTFVLLLAERENLSLLFELDRMDLTS